MVPARFMTNDRSMLRTCYEVAFFTMRKPQSAD